MKERQSPSTKPSQSHPNRPKAFIQDLPKPFSKNPPTPLDKTNKDASVPTTTFLENMLSTRLNASIQGPSSKRTNLHANLHPPPISELSPKAKTLSNTTTERAKNASPYPTRSLRHLIF
jgi:hypothetical protein